ncbi:MAG: hypothetical protein KGD59_16055 [Candidatus Heimdallarchaeota archaeon]|nr:hypothetical protein [Candidatus Heimdallarchaeota archaeon]MBY8996065.1 hypothetical protein [Candidatus Heimdallarchaeota archaeon]
MIKSIAKCHLCGKTEDRDNMILYNFPNGPRVICKDCFRTLPPDPSRGIPRPDGKKRKPHEDIFPPIG